MDEHFSESLSVGIFPHFFELLVHRTQFILSFRHQSLALLVIHNIHLTASFHQFALLRHAATLVDSIVRLLLVVVVIIHFHFNHIRFLFIL